MMEWLVNNEFERIWKEVGMDLFEVLLWHLLRRTVEGHRTLEWLFSQERFEPGPSKIQVRCIAAMSILLSNMHKMFCPNSEPS
jgi:hypothetical protein